MLYGVGTGVKTIIIIIERNIKKECSVLILLLQCVNYCLLKVQQSGQRPSIDKIHIYSICTTDAF